MLTGGYIKLFRSLVSWEWYDDINVKTLFIHLLLTVNYEPKQWQGMAIETGQRVTSLEKLSKEIHLTIRQTRTALDKLKKTGEISIITTNKYTLITVENYTKYQVKEKETDKQTTNERQTDDKRTTTMEEVNKNINNNKYSVLETYTVNDDLRQAINDFLEMRKKIKKPMTERALKMLLGKLDELAATDENKIKVLDQSILHNWQTIYPLKEQEQDKQIKPQQEFIPTFVYRDL